ncbi:MAG TPA: carboxymuconolactone decarboxylase family protein [Mycobacteriales bacterium]|nr:carboxymuconolactone decarboxylase family protein [Mycobacteriales bacterium]
MTDAPTATRIAPSDRETTQPLLNIFRTLSRNRDLYKAFLALGGHLLRGEALPAREREIVILRAGWNCASEYEFGQHTVLGAAAGLSEQEIAALAEAAAVDWSEDDRALIAMVDELCSADVVGEGTWQALSHRWNDEQLLELLVLAGFYRLVSGLLNSAGVALEATTPGWPPAAQPRRRAPRDGEPS